MVALLFSRLMDYRHDRRGTLGPRFEEVVLEAGKTLWVGRQILSARPQAIRKEGIPRNTSRFIVARLSQPDPRPTNTLDMQSPLLPPLVTWRSRIGRTNRRMTAGRAQEQPLRDAADLAAAMLLKQQHGFPNLARYLRRIPPTKSAPRRAPLAASCPMIMVNGSLRLFLDALQAWQI